MKKHLFYLLFIGSTFTHYLYSQTIEFQAEINDSIYSNTLNEYRNFWVKLPENYNPDNKDDYPVIYLLDGFSLKNNLEIVYENYWGHYLPHMILVGISNSENRTRDLTTSQIKMSRGTAMDSETGGAEDFINFIEKELIPYIDNKYPTSSFRTLIGHSYAGLFTINMLLNHNSLFKNFIAIDPSIEWDNQNILKQAKIKLKEQNFDGKSLFISLAAEQLHMQNEKITMENIIDDKSEFSLFSRSIIEFSNFASSQKQNGLNFLWKVYPEDLHGTVPLPSIRDGLVFLFNWYQFKSPQSYNNPETSVEELTELLKAQEEIYATNFGYSVPPMVEEVFNGYGYMNMHMGQPKKAYLFFKMNIDYYPNSANAYDSMADYYLSEHDHENALKMVKKAFEINNSDYYKERLDTISSKNK